MDFACKLFIAKLGVSIMIICKEASTLMIRINSLITTTLSFCSTLSLSQTLTLAKEKESNCTGGNSSMQVGTWSKLRCAVVEPRIPRPSEQQTTFLDCRKEKKIFEP
jgi:hypothetical protein